MAGPIGRRVDDVIHFFDRARIFFNILEIVHNEPDIVIRFWVKNKFGRVPDQKIELIFGIGDEKIKKVMSDTAADPGDEYFFHPIRSTR